MFPKTFFISLNSFDAEYFGMIELLGAHAYQFAQVH